MSAYEWIGVAFAILCAVAAAMKYLIYRDERDHESVCRKIADVDEKVTTGFSRYVPREELAQRFGSIDTNLKDLGREMNSLRAELPRDVMAQVDRVIQLLHNQNK